MITKQLFLILMAILTFGCSKQNNSAETSKMNIVFINNEDLTTRAIGCYGNKIVKTPHIDNLAKSGIQFQRAYCSAPMCNPSRAAFCTGVRPEATNILTNQHLMKEVTPHKMKGIAGVLQPKGAYLVNLGKLYHGREKNERYNEFDRLEYCPIPNGFAGISKYTENYHCPERRFNYTSDSELEAELLKRKKVFEEKCKEVPMDDPSWWFDVGKEYIGFYFQIFGDSGIPEACDEDYKKARIAGEIIRECANENKQFFLSIGFSKPHTPVVAPKKYVDMYNPENIPLPVAKPENDTLMPAAAKRFGAKADIFTGWFDDEFPQLAETPKRQKEAIAAYYAAASFIDAQIGYLVNVLKETGVYDNTIVIFFADHGFHLGEHGLWSKYSVFEEATRVPLIVRVPGASANGKQCNEIVELVDILPTICDLWQVEKPGYLQSTSFMPLLNQPALPWKKAAFTTFTLEGVADTNVIGYSVRSKDYRFTQWGNNGEYGFELYDFNKDPLEQKNVAFNGAYATVRMEMEQYLKEGWKSAVPVTGLK